LSNSSFIADGHWAYAFW